MKDNSGLRVILAVVFSFLFIVVYSHFFVKPQQDNLSESNAKNQKNAPDITYQDSKAVSTQENYQQENEIIATIESKAFEIQIDNLGRISQVYLKDKKYTTAPEIGFFDHFKVLFGIMEKPKALEKLPMLNPKSLRPLEMRFSNQEINTESFKTSYTASDKKIVVDSTSPKKLILTQKLKNIEIKKILTFYENLQYDIQIEVSNPSEQYFITNGARPVTDKENYAFNGVILEKFDGKIEKIEDGDATETKTFNEAKFLASVDRYYTTLFYSKGQKIDALIDGDFATKNPIPYLYAKGSLDFGGFIGPKDYQQLKSINPVLVDVVEYGMMTFFAKPLFLLLEFLHQYLNNWGWAIIVLTIIVKIVLYPLSYKGMVSMQKLKDLAPKMKEIQERYKGDAQKLQMHMMQLYKKHGANPMGGCFPLLIQIPIFYAIYRVLYNSVELKSAEFIFWIHDLSVMDPFFVLPILMGVSMYIQQVLTPNTFTDPIQAKVFRTLPVIFTVFLIFFPAGLVLYWTINNILSIFQQLSINRMLERKKQKEIQEHKKT
ncbi:MULTISPECIES: membrane protein insertase YidC [unclassified Helicobacter]|uniref:membrane protein insertase YidC n=1 Tax=unclassified Helicobacter TaxID=2593540 RepID=UPI000CF15CCD|nr:MULTISPECIES: membrane protein insertase YidC [unclassified Helicobacter]